MTSAYSLRVPAFVLLALIGLGAVSLAWSAQQLPQQVASHFDAEGKPNDWMNRSDYLRSIGVAGLLFPLFLVGIGLMTQVLPSGSINLPHRQYWLSAERRTETNRYLSRHMVWLACMVMALLISINGLVVQANRTDPAFLSNVVWPLVIAFVGGVVSWLVVMIRHFSRLPCKTGEQAGDDSVSVYSH